MKTKINVLGVTGHRPAKLGGYGENIMLLLYQFGKRKLEELDPNMVITGMALGWDQVIAQVCIDIDIPFTAAIPCLNQDKMWPDGSKDYYKKLLNKAEEIQIVTPGPYAAWKMNKRNEYIVDLSDHMLSLWDGTKAGGTYHCINYAQLKSVTVDNVWDDWKDYSAVII